MTTRKGDLSHFQFSSFSLLEYKGLIGDGSHGDGDVRRRLLHACKTVRTKRLIISCEGVDDPVSSVVFFSAVPNIGKVHGPRAEA